MNGAEQCRGAGTASRGAETWKDMIPAGARMERVATMRYAGVQAELGCGPESVWNPLHRDQREWRGESGPELRIPRLRAILLLYRE